MQSLPGVANVEINAEETTATVTVDPETFSAADAVAKLSNSGFPAQTATAISDGAEDETPDDAAEATEEAAESSEEAATEEENTDEPTSEEASSEETAAEESGKESAAESDAAPAETESEEASS